MKVWLLHTVAVILTACGTSDAVCPSCPFRWVKNQNTCYRYFPEALSSEEAMSFCESYSDAGRVAKLATVTSPEELTYIMEYIDKIFVNASSAEVPKNVWISNNIANSLNYQSGHQYLHPILHRALNSTPSQKAEISPKEYQIAGDSSLIQRVPAPDVVDHACAVYAKVGSYLDLGDFRGTCISDPSLCESMTWSLWLKIDTSSGFNGYRYYISSGGQTNMARGIAFFYTSSSDLFTYMVRSASDLHVKTYSSFKIPLNKWFHLAVVQGIARNPPFNLYINGAVVVHDAYTHGPGKADLCFKLYLGMGNTCDMEYPALVWGGNAAYSDLMVFDHFLTSGDIETIHACGSLKWDLRVRSLIMKSDLEYECTASDSAGSIITWSLYHKQTDSWENLDTPGDGYTIQSVDVSTCVVRSTLVVSSSQVSPSAISCTAHAGPNNATEIIYRVWTENGQLRLTDQAEHYYGQDGNCNECEKPNVKAPFICMKTVKG